MQKKTNEKNPNTTDSNKNSIKTHATDLAQARIELRSKKYIILWTMKIISLVVIIAIVKL